MTDVARDLERLLSDIGYIGSDVEDMRLSADYGSKAMFVEVENHLDEALDAVRAAIDALKGA